MFVGCEEEDNGIIFPDTPNRYSIPYPPELLEAIPIDSTRDVKLTWKDNSDNENGFEIKCITTIQIHFFPVRKHNINSGKRMVRFMDSIIE